MRWRVETGYIFGLTLSVGTYVELHCFEHFSDNKYQHFEGMPHTLYIVMVLSNKLNGFPSATCGGGFFVARNADFQATATIKYQQLLTIFMNPTVVFSYLYYSFELPVVLVNFHM